MPQTKDNLPVNAEAQVSDGGTITYANEVIAIISGIAAGEVEGIAGMVTAGGLGEIISRNRNITRGVKVEVGTEEVSVDLYTIVEYGQPIQKVASEVQENVRKSIESMTGLRVVRVDIHVQGVSFEKDKQDAQNRLEAANVQHLQAPEQPRRGMKAAKEPPEAKAQAAEAQKPEASDAQESQNVVPEIVQDAPMAEEASPESGDAALENQAAPAEKQNKKPPAKRRKA